MVCNGIRRVNIMLARKPEGEIDALIVRLSFYI